MTSRPHVHVRHDRPAQGRDHHPRHDVLELRQSRRPRYVSPSTVLLTVLPLFHTGGLNCYTNRAACRRRSLIMRAFDPGLALQLISDPSYGITNSSACPRSTSSWRNMLCSPRPNFSRLGDRGVGGAPMRYRS